VQTFRNIAHKFVNGLGITQPLDTTKQSTEFLLGGLLLVLVLGGLAL
jgi:hypothetical protein